MELPKTMIEKLKVLSFPLPPQKLSTAAETENSAWNTSAPVPPELLAPEWK